MIDHGGEAIRKIDETLAFFPGEDGAEVSTKCWRCLRCQDADVRLTSIGLCHDCRAWVRGDSDHDPLDAKRWWLPK